MNGIEEESIPADDVVPDTPNRLREAIEHLVLVKRALNDRRPKPPGYLDWACSLDPDRFIDQQTPDFACWPTSTLTAVLPFFAQQVENSATPRPARVPVASLIGSSHKWTENSIPASTRSEEGWEEYFCSDKRFWDHPADVTHIRQLGLFYVGLEGKNRVAFLARRGVKSMPCLLKDSDYPSADRLQVIEVWEGPLRTWLCILDGDLTCTISYPELSLPILDAYGVRRDREWPFPDVLVATVMNAIRGQKSDQQILGTRSSPVKQPVSLQDLARAESELRTSVKPSWQSPIVSDLIDFDWLRWAAVSGGLFLAALALRFVGTIESTFAVGALFGWLALGILRVRPKVESSSDALIATKAAERPH